MNITCLYKCFTLVFLLVGIFCVVQLADASPPEGHDFMVVSSDAIYKPGELLVKFAPKADGKQRSTEEKKQILISLGGAALKHDFKLVHGLSLVKLPAGLTVKEALKTFNSNDGILYAEPNYRIYFASTVPNDFYYQSGSLWGMNKIDANYAWDIATDANDVIVAVLDTGVDYNHPDLADNMWINEAEYNGDPNVDDDDNGYIDDIHGWDFSDDNEADPMDYIYHGTHCAGIIGAVGDNNEGVVGVCWNVKIMPLALCTDAYDQNVPAWFSSAVRAIDYAVDKGARVLNNSWGADYDSNSLKDTIVAAEDEGVLFITIPHNYNSDIDEEPIYPASYDFNNIVVVLGTDQYDNKVSTSSFGANSVDLGAPGKNILSCGLNDGYLYMDGTSMAAPHVAGAAALIWAVNPYLSYLEVKDILLDTVDHLYGLEGKCVTEGRLNLYKALYKASLYPGPGGFCIKSDLGEPIARFDNFGNLFLKGTLTQSTAPTATANDEFIVKDSNNVIVAIIDMTDGNMYIKGSLHHKQEMSQLFPEGFIIKNSSGDVVAYIDDSGEDSGHVYIKGKLYMQ